MKIMKDLVQAFIRIPHDAAGNHRVPVGTGRHRAEHSERSYESITMCNMERRRECQRGKIACYFACRGHYQCELSNMNKPHRCPFRFCSSLATLVECGWRAYAHVSNEPLKLSRLSHRHPSHVLIRAQPPIKDIVVDLVVALADMSLLRDMSTKTDRKCDIEELGLCRPPVPFIITFSNQEEAMISALRL